MSGCLSNTHVLKAIVGEVVVRRWFDDLYLALNRLWTSLLKQRPLDAAENQNMTQFNVSCRPAVADAPSYQPFENRRDSILTEQKFLR